MPKFRVAVTLTQGFESIIEAESEDEAYEKAEDDFTLMDTTDWAESWECIDDIDIQEIPES